MKHYIFCKCLESKQDLTGHHSGVRGVWCQEMGLLSKKKKGYCAMVRDTVQPDRI